MAAITLTFSTAGANTCTFPVGQNTADSVECWAGGAGGSNRGANGVSGGGGGGAYSKSTPVAVVPGYIHNLVVGAAGTTSGGAGGNSSFNNATNVIVVQAEGGRGPGSNNATGAAGGVGANGLGDTKYNGGGGASGSANAYGGGGGSSAGTALNGVTANNNVGATAPTGGGNGGNGSTGSGAGSAGVAPGGGGGGGDKTSGTARLGGAGAVGKVIVIYTPVTQPVTCAITTITGNATAYASPGSSNSHIDAISGTLTGWGALSGNTTCVAVPSGNMGAPASFKLSLSSNIAANAATATTYQLTAPSGKTSANFAASDISDDTNPVPALDLGSNQYTEIEWCIAGQNSSVAVGDIYQFRVSDNGTALDTYTLTPTWTVSDNTAIAGNTACSITSIVAYLQLSARPTCSTTPTGTITGAGALVGTTVPCVATTQAAFQMTASVACAVTPKATLGLYAAVTCSTSPTGTMAGAGVLIGTTVSCTCSASATFGLAGSATCAVTTTATLGLYASVSCAASPTGTMAGAGALIGTPVACTSSASASFQMTAKATCAVTTNAVISGIGATMFNLSPSANIAASAATVTTYQLTSPVGKSSSDFQAGAISDDTNPITIDLASGKYTELEWCIVSSAGVSISDIYQFRVSDNGAVLDTYTLTPTWTVGDPGAASATIVCLCSTTASLGAGAISSVPVACSVSASGTMQGAGVLLGDPIACAVSATGTMGAPGSLSAHPGCAVSISASISYSGQQPFSLYPSSYIAPSAATATTHQMTAPSGSSYVNFQAGKISDDTNPITLDLTSGSYTELEWSITSAPGLSLADIYQFRVSDNGTVLDTYSKVPTWTIGNPGAASATVICSVSTNASMLQPGGMIGSSTCAVTITGAALKGKAGLLGGLITATSSAMLSRYGGSATCTSAATGTMTGASSIAGSASCSSVAKVSRMVSSVSCASTVNGTIRSAGSITGSATCRIVTAQGVIRATGKLIGTTACSVVPRINNLKGAGGPCTVTLNATLAGSGSKSATSTCRVVTATGALKGDGAISGTTACSSSSQASFIMSGSSVSTCTVTGVLYVPMAAQAAVSCAVSTNAILDGNGPSGHCDCTCDVYMPMMSSDTIETCTATGNLTSIGSMSSTVDCTAYAIISNLQAADSSACVVPDVQLDGTGELVYSDACTCVVSDITVTGDGALSGISTNTVWVNISSLSAKVDCKSVVWAIATPVAEGYIESNISCSVTLTTVLGGTGNAIGGTPCVVVVNALAKGAGALKSNPSCISDGWILYDNGIRDHKKHHRYSFAYGGLK